ncbi:MAG: hypothetical protein KAV18_05300 [Candidatus Omnitrophica bacterium]|nr:hypothetical protein [Candidatus Omnitrophota bacterium]
MRAFYLVYQKYETVSPKFKLSWSHYIFLIRIIEDDERNLKCYINDLENNEIKQ